MNRKITANFTVDTQQFHSIITASPHNEFHSTFITIHSDSHQLKKASVQGWRQGSDMVDLSTSIRNYALNCLTHVIHHGSLCNRCIFIVDYDMLTVFAGTTVEETIYKAVCQYANRMHGHDISAICRTCGIFRNFLLTPLL